MAIQSFFASSCVLRRQLDAGRVVAFQTCGLQRGAAAGKGVEDMAAWLADPDQFAQQRKRFLGLVQPLCGRRHTLAEDAGQHRCFAVDGHGAVAAPNDELCLLAKAAFLRPLPAVSEVQEECE